MASVDLIVTKTKTRKIDIAKAGENLEQQVVGICDEMGAAGYQLASSAVLERSILVLIFHGVV